MSFAARITRMPVPFEQAPAAEIAAHFADLAPELRDLVAGTAGCSPYLRDLALREADWLRAALTAAPEEVLDAELAAATGETDNALRTALRTAKRRAALLAGLADLGGVWALEEVTGALTRLADTATDRALKLHVATEIARGKLPGATTDDIATAGGAVALAMGKMGAGELNYSSDIDLIMLFDESRYDRDDFHEARASFIRATRRMSATLSEMTADGYVFRTDLRLRPDPSVTPVILAMATAESYYESLGRTWERAAHIKARACAGDIAAGEAYLERLTPFVWRRHLDFAAIEDAHAMRLRIREYKGVGGPITLEGHDMKLGRGGIREIEFFTQTRQLISGGRDPDLRLRGTVPGLAVLAEKGWEPVETAKTLTRHYRRHREIEHRVQMVRDAQTHKLPNDPDEMRRIVNMMGETDVPAWRRALTEALTEVHGLTEGFFAPEEKDAALPDFSDEDEEIISRWRSYPACRSTRASQIFERLKPELLARLGKAARPREALVHFDAFLRGLPAGVQLFSLFEANTPLVDLIVDIAATAPALSAYLGRNAQVLDAVLGGDFFKPWPGVEGLTKDLAEKLAEELGGAAGDYEMQLDTARRWKKEWHFRIGVHHLRGLISGRDVGAQYADLAEAVLAALWPAVVESFSEKHGAPPGRGAALIGMGSLGARTTSATSDLDIIVIYDAAGEEASEGRRPLAARAYYARLTQAMVTALSAPMSEGKLYEVDMRLRPSGRQGPVATSLDSFRSYQAEEAWTWEHLALSRARAVAGDPGIGADVDAVRAEVLARPRDAAQTIRDVIDMRARIEDAKGGAGDAFEAKIGPGRMQDIELLGQCATLLARAGPHDVEGQIARGVETGWIAAAEARALTRAYDLLWRLQSAAKLLTDGRLDLDAIGLGGREFLLRETGMETTDDLASEIERRVMAAQGAIEAALARSPEATDGGGLPEAADGGGLPEAADGGRSPEAADGAGVPEATDGGGLPEATDGGGLPEAADGGGLPEAADGGRSPEAADGAGLPEAIDGGGSPEATLDHQAPEATNGQTPAATTTQVPGGT